MKYTPIMRTRVNPIARHLSIAIMKILGWRVEGGECSLDKAVVTAAPHNSNWDLLYTLLSAATCDVPIWFMMKHTLFWWPLRILWYYLGGVSIDRTASNSVISQMVKIIHDSDHMYLVITPEGTRKKVAHWKSGFYYIAHEAGIPIWPWYINYEKKCTGSGPLIYTTGDMEADFEKIRSFYEEHCGPMPECRPAPPKQDGGADAQK